MENEEKLRTLLIEARDVLLRSFAVGMEDPYACSNMAARITDALAEPVGGCARCEESEHAMHLRVRAGYDAAVADSWRAKVAEVERERDEARAELDFIKAEYGGADDDSLTRDALLLKLRLLESEMDAERASRRMYERAHDDILEALKRAEADAYHPEDGEPVALWGVERLAKERDAARTVLSSLCSEFEGAVRHADWRAAGSPGMSVPFTGDFASATQLPSIVGRMRWWARELRKVIGEDKP